LGCGSFSQIAQILTDEYKGAGSGGVVTTSVENAGDFIRNKLSVFEFDLEF
jgi:hypothetical protein